MKATGIVRRIDDLGRVIIPKEIRRTLILQEGDPMEIYIHEGTVCFAKYDIYESPKDALEIFKKSISECDGDIDYLKRIAINEKIAELNGLLKEEN